MLVQAWWIAESFGFFYHKLERGLHTSRSNNSATSTPSDGRTPSGDSILWRASEYHPRCRSDRVRIDCAGAYDTNAPVGAVTGFSKGVRQDIPLVPVRHNEDLWAKRVVHWSTKEHYVNAVPSVQINGNIAGPIPIRSSIRQDCAMSMVLFALCINPLIRVLKQNLSGVRLGQSGRRMVVVDYADDVIIFVKKPTEFWVI